MIASIMTLKAAIEAKVKELEADWRSNREKWRGCDWWQLDWDEEMVFNIDPQRWPRMMAAWFFFETFHGRARADDDDAPVALLYAERTLRSDIDDTRIGFDRFATEYMGLTLREADAAHGKMSFSNVREGITMYRDEDGFAAKDDPVK